MISLMPKLFPILSQLAAREKNCQPKQWGFASFDSKTREMCSSSISNAPPDWPMICLEAIKPIMERGGINSSMSFCRSVPRFHFMTIELARENKLVGSQSFYRNVRCSLCATIPGTRPGFWQIRYTERQQVQKQ